MPQMMPLFWAPLFISFTILMGLALTKVYFYTNKIMNFSPKTQTKILLKEFKWMW